MNTIRRTSPGTRAVVAALSAAIATAGLGLAAPASFADDAADAPAVETGAEPVVQDGGGTDPVASPYSVTMLTSTQAAADEALSAQAQSASLTRVAVTLDNNASTAAALYDAVDALRAGSGLAAATRDAGLEQAAYQRAAETSLLACNLRPDGTLFSTASSGRATAEIVVQASADVALDANELLASLSAEQIAELNAATNVGIALVTNPSGAYWAIELASDGAASEAPATADAAATYRIEVASENVQVTYAGGDLAVEVGTPQSAPMQATVSGTIAYGGSAATFTATELSLDPTACTWNTSNPAVATADVNGLVSGVGNGSCTVSATDAAGNQFIYSVTVSGGEPAATVTDLADCTVLGITGPYEETGEAIAPAFSVSDANNIEVDAGQYHYAFTDNVAPGTATLTITANEDSNTLTGEISRTFEIVAAAPAQVTVPSVTNLGTEDAAAALAASGLVANLVEGAAAPDEASAGVVYAADPVEGSIVAAGSTVTLSYYTAPVAPASDTTDLVAAGAAVSVSPNPATYTGAEVTPAVSVSLTDAAGNVIQLVEGTDYTVAYTNNVEVTTAETPATASVTGIGAYSGTVSATFQIVEAAATTTDLAAAGYAVDAIAAQAYTGEAIAPVVTLSGPSALVEGQDYTVTFANNVAPGAATATITGVGAYSGTLTATFSIQADISAAQVSGLGALTYTGAALTPAPVVTLGGTTLEAGTDYDLAYANNTNVGTATITITGKGAYTGTLLPVFTIEAKSLQSAQITPIAETTYTGGAITPQVTVTDGTTVLTSGKDYTVTYEQNVNAGTAHVIVTGTGNYRDSIETTFQISAISMERTTVVMPNMAYTGGALTPKPVSVTVNGITLVEGTDFDIVGYANNTNVGSATATLQGKGNFTGTVTANWKIVQQGTQDAGTTQTLPKTGDATNIVGIVIGAVVGLALVITAGALIIHRARANKRTR